MDFSNISIDDLKKMRDSYQKDVIILKDDLKLVELAMNNPDKQIVNQVHSILENKHSTSFINSINDITDDSDIKEEAEFLKKISKIKSLKVSEKLINNNEEDTNLYLYTCNIKFDKLHVELEYESNLAPDDEYLSPENETLTKLNIKILQPNVQAKLQDGIDFFQENPCTFNSAILFLKRVNHLIEKRLVVIKKLYTYDKNLIIGTSNNSDQYHIVFKSMFDDTRYLHIRWNFIWELRTGLARDYLTAKILHTDKQLLEEIKPLIDQLCSDKFTYEFSSKDKMNLFHKILIAIKDADTRNYTKNSS